MMKPIRLLALSLALSSALAAHAQTTPPADEKKPEPPAKTEDQKKAEEFDKFVKDLKRVEGQFTMYQKGKQLFLELPESRLGKLFLIQATWATGGSAGLQAGDPTNYGAVDAFRFDKQEDKLWLVKPNRRFRWSKDDPLALASERSFPEAILGSFTVSQTHPAKKLLLFDVTNLFYGDVFKLGAAVNMGLGGQFMLDREKSGPAHVKSFPKNTVVQMNLFYQSSGGANPMAELMALLGQSGDQLEDTRSAPLKMTYNLWFREESDYKPRLADPRIGYFTEDFYSVDRFLNTDRTERYIQRWNLKKKDPMAAISEPVKPIVWILDPSIPAAYRDSVRNGILFWNKAFEKLGYKNAVQVQDAPSDKDYDHADGRYNVLRWTMTPDAGYAVALFRTDPFTGEILNASVTFDANMLYFAQQEALNTASPSANARQRAAEVLLRREKATTTDEFHLWATDRERFQHALDAAFNKNGWSKHACRYGHGLADSASFAYSAALAGGGFRMSKEDYAKQFITDVVSHEVGHCMGLRHNFVASTNLTAQQLADDRITNERGITASVMDYTPANIMAALRGGRNFYTPTIGAYDQWAIKYGYMDVAANSPVGERFALDALASQSTQPSLSFMTDQDADSFNPYVARFDNAKDPLAYSEAMFEAAKRIRKYAIQNLPRPGESQARRTALILSSITTVMRQGQLSARFMGGVAAKRHFTGKTVAPVPADDQRRAMRLISACLSPEVANLPVDVRQSLGRDMNIEDSSSWTAPLRDLVGTRQLLIISQVMSASTIDRIAENAFKWGNTPGAYTMDEHYRSIVSAVFKEVGQNTNVDALRRDLQRVVASGLMTQAGAPAGAVNDDARMLAAENLRGLSSRLASQIRTGKVDGMTTAHYRDMKMQIDRFLNRQAVGN